MAELDQLLEDLSSEDEDRAQAAIPALSVHGPAAIEALTQLLDSPIADRRWWATYALSAFKAEPEAQKAIIRMLRDPDNAVQQCAALALKHNPSLDALSQLLVALHSKDRLTARLAGDALAALGAPAVPQLAEASKDPMPAVRIEAVRALAEMRHPDAIGPLFKCIDDPSSVVTHWAEEGLDRLGIGMMFFNP
ncbi:MAG: HEAT repeat domain-containing protein [Anaerolineales bacterium]